MAVTVGVDSFVSQADADAYNLAVGNTTWASTASDDKDIALRIATNYIKAKYDGVWKGIITDIDQVLPWPRSGVVDNENRYLSSTVNPSDIDNSTSELAFKSLTETLIVDTSIGGQPIRKKIGPIETEWSVGATTFKHYNQVERLIRPYITNDPSGTNKRLIRK